MIILDTNVVSELMRPRPTEGVVEWIVSQDSRSLYLSTVSEAELRFGVEILPTGQRARGASCGNGNHVSRGFCGAHPALRQRVCPSVRGDRGLSAGSGAAHQPR